MIPQTRCFCRELKAVSRIYCLGSKKSRCLNQSEKVPQRYSRESPEFRILSGVLRPLLGRTDQTLTALERLVLPQTARRTRITARKHRPRNTTQETQPDAPIKRAGVINIQNSRSDSTAHARPGDSLSDCVLQLSLHKARFYGHLRLNFSFTINVDVSHSADWD